MIISQPFKRLARAEVKRRGLHLVADADNATLLDMHLRHVFARHRVDVVIDVGARFGEYGVFLRKMGYRGPILSFEPVSSNFALLQERASTDPSWSIHRLALGATRDRQDINVTEASSFSSFLPPNDYSRRQFGHRSSVSTVETVKVERLDEVWSQLPISPQARVYLKMDTQGWDLNVLRGATTVLDQIVGIQSEVSVRAIYQGMPGWTDSITEFTKLGFAVSGLFPVSLDAALRVIEFDCVCVRDRGEPDDASGGQ